MNKEDFKKLRSLIKEEAHLAEEYTNIICFPKEIVSDSTKDYSTGEPHTITITGYGDSEFVKAREKLYQKQRQIQAKIYEMETFLDEVEDPEVRDILRLQYRNGLTQEEIAQELGYSRSGIAMKIDRFWKSQKCDRSDKKSML